MSDELRLVALGLSLLELAVRLVRGLATRDDAEKGLDAAREILKGDLTPEHVHQAEVSFAVARDLKTGGR